MCWNDKNLGKFFSSFFMMVIATIIDTPKLLERLKCESKGENNGKMSWERPLTRNILEIKNVC